MSQSKDYQRIEQAIHFIVKQFPNQPSLDDIARSVHLSPFHFQRMFQQWAGVSPKKFMQFISIEYAKTLLEQKQPLHMVAQEVGLSGSSRLHDLFINIESMTPGEYKNGGAQLDISYEFYDSPFGEAIIASTHRGICHMAFEDSQQKAINNLEAHFPNAHLEQKASAFQQDALKALSPANELNNTLTLHLSGTPFQIKVWQSLLKIPSGQLANYAEIAEQIGQPKAARAVGSAIANNNIAYLIPCHRVIRNTGQLGNYRWGSPRKTAMIGWEAAQLDHGNRTNE